MNHAPFRQPESHAPNQPETITMYTKTPEQIQNKPFFYKPFFIPPKSTIFAERATRFDELSAQDTSDWREYLTLMAHICRAQDTVLQANPQPLPPSSGNTQLPACDGNTIPADFLMYLDGLIQALYNQVNPTIQAALNDLTAHEPHQIKHMAAQLLRDELPPAQHVFQIYLHAALQIIWTAWAMALRDDDVPSVEERSMCPCCGGEAVASVILNGGDWHGLRYLHCGLCNSRWNALRAKCTFCNDQSAISLSAIDEPAAPAVFKGARAERCGQCGHYRKLFLLPEQQYADPIADDLASLALDVLMGDDHVLRGGHNPFLLG